MFRKEAQLKARLGELLQSQERAIARNCEKERSECRDLGLEPTFMFVSGNPNWLGQDMRRQLGRTFNASHSFKAIRLSAQALAC